MCARVQRRAIGSDARSGQRRRAGTVGSMYAVVVPIITAVVRCCLIAPLVLASSIRDRRSGIARVFELAARVDRGGSSGRVQSQPYSLVSRTRSHMSRVSSVCVGLVVGVGCSHFPKACRAVGASASKSMPASKGVDRAPAKVPNRGRRRWKQQLPCQARTSRAGPGSVATCCSRRLSPTQRRQRAAPGGDEHEQKECCDPRKSPGRRSARLSLLTTDRRGAREW